MKRTGLFWGVVLIVLGTLLLLRSLGIIQIDVWGLIWPVALILFGVSVLWGAMSGPRRGDTQQASIPLEGAGQAEVQIYFGAGRLTVNNNAGPNEIVNGSFEGGLDHTARRDGDTLRVKLQMPDMEWFNFPWMWGNYRRDWRMGLNPGVAYTLLDVNAGAAESELDLSNLRVAKFKLSTGASSTTITMPANAGLTEAEIGAGAASVTVRVPTGVAAHIRFRGGVASLSVDPARFPNRGGDYESPDYASAANKLDLRIDAGAGSIDIH